MHSSRTRAVMAWSVHAFTLTGIIWATLALLALFNDQPKLMWLYLGIALVVDGVDGTLARKAEVTTHAPHFDGVILDSIIDYLTWTFIPALFLFRTGLLGEGPLAVILLLLINVSSMFCYANTKMKSNDYYFLGFPAAWNLVALALWLLSAGTVVNMVIVIVLAALTWAPIAFVHPLRVKRFRTLNIIASVAWIVTSAVLVVAYPFSAPWTGTLLLTSAIWLACGAWLLLTGIFRTVSTTRALR